jgi:hypothetical protein
MRLTYVSSTEGGWSLVMTQEEAVALLEIFRRDDADPPRIDPAKLAHAYIAILGSLSK